MITTPLSQSMTPFPMAETRARRIMIAEDDAEMRTLISWSMLNAGHEVLHARSGLELLDRVAVAQRDGMPVDLVITDVRMPGMNGLEALDWLSELKCKAPVIVITAFGDRKTHSEARRLGAWAVVDKPFDLDDLQILVDEILAR